MDGHKYTQPGVETLKLCFACTAKECILTTVMSQTGDLVIRKLTHKYTQERRFKRLQPTGM